MWTRLSQWKRCNCFTADGVDVPDYTDPDKNVKHRPAAQDGGRMPGLFPTFPPPAPEDIITNLEKYRQDVREIIYVWPQGDVDTPVKCLYRLYQYVMMDQNIGLRNILEYWWFHPDWRLEQIPDPKDKVPSRYAALAAITGLLVESFRRRYELGLPRNGRSVFTNDEIEEMRNTRQRPEQGPKWARKVPPLSKILKIPTSEDVTLESFDDERASQQFKEKSILVWQPHIHFT